MIPNKPPIPDAILQSIVVQDYAAILLCKDNLVIKAISIDNSLSVNSLNGIELDNWLPKELLSGSHRRAIVKLPDLDLEEQYCATITKLPQQESHLNLVVTLQVLPENLVNETLQLHKIEQYRYALLAESPIFLYVLDYKTKLFTQGLEDFAQLLGYTSDEIRTMHDGVYSPIHPEDMAAIEAQEEAMLNSDDSAPISVKYRLRNKQGKWHWFQSNSIVINRDQYNVPTQEIGSIFKIESYSSEFSSVEKQAKYFRTIVENSYDCTLVYNKDMEVTYMSPSITEVTGYTEDDLMGKSLANFVYEEDRKEAASNMLQMTEDDTNGIIVERRINHKDGRVIWIESRLSNHLNDPDIQGVTINFHTIDDRKKAEGKIHNLANYDPLTQLPNRYLFKKRLLKGLAKAVKEEQKLALMYIDLDRFKEINDTLGHAVGDSLLQSVSKNISKCLREGDTLARVGGDEFTIVLPNTTEKEAGYIATRILEQFQTPFRADQHTVQTGVSIGISIFPNHTKKADDLFRYADIAMYSAKQERNQYKFYQVHHSERENKRRSIEKKLRVAISNADLRLYYQPRVDIKTGAIKSVEALCRWYDPDSGDISPGVFIPIAEETTMVNDLSRLVTDMACKQVVQWRNMGIDTTVALNLSIKDLKNFNITRQFSDTMSMYDIPGESLEIEITESAAMTDVVNTVNVLNQFKELDIQISIDDFGKGYSSLAYLSQLPVDNLKIDMYFIQQLGSQKRDRLVNVNIIRSIISLARSLELKTVGEGIETIQQMSILNSLGCDLGQGMLYCRPLSANALTDILRQGIISFPSQ